MLVEPDTRAAASLYYTDPDYDALANLVGAGDPSGLVGEVDTSGPSHEFGSGVTVTWLIHDVAVWRVDRIFLEATGRTLDLDPAGHERLGHVYDSPVTWHTGGRRPGADRAARADGLRAGCDAGAPARSRRLTTGCSGSVTPGDAGDGATSHAAQPAQTDAGHGWVGWGLAGLALGVALAVAALRGARPAHRRSSRPRREPAEPTADDASGTLGRRPEAADDELGWSLAEEMSWAEDRAWPSPLSGTR